MKTYSVNKSDCNIGDGDLTVIELEQGDMVLTKEEVNALRIELMNHYISYSHKTARDVVRKLMDN